MYEGEYHDAYASVSICVPCASLLKLLYTHRTKRSRINEKNFSISVQKIIQFEITAMLYRVVTHGLLCPFAARSINSFAFSSAFGSGLSLAVSPIERRYRRFINRRYPCFESKEQPNTERKSIPYGAFAWFFFFQGHTPSESISQVVPVSSKSNGNTCLPVALS